MTYMPRHGAADHGLRIRPDGYIPVADLLAHRSLRQFTEEQVRLTVARSAKVRFKILEEGAVLLVRAQQGHSTRVGEVEQDKLLTRITPANVPPTAIHGTFENLLAPILKEGLKTMGRYHIHMAAGLPGDGREIAGCRAGTDTFLHIDVHRAIADGYEFFRSGNGTILTPGLSGLLPAQYIKAVTDRTGSPIEGLEPRPRPRGSSNSPKTPGLRRTRPRDPSLDTREGPPLAGTRGVKT
jgi:2'-phosphotransferase